MTQMNIDEMPAGGEMDALIAQKVMGWVRGNASIEDPPNPRLAVWKTGGGKTFIVHARIDAWHPSANFVAARKVVQHLSRQGIEVVVLEGFHDNLSACMMYEGIATSYPPRDAFLHLAAVEETCNYWGYLCVRTQAETVPLAISRAALKVIKGPPGHNTKSRPNLTTAILSSLPGALQGKLGGSTGDDNGCA